MADTEDESREITVGVLSLHSSKETKAILNAIEALGHEGVWLREENAAVRIEGGRVELEPDVDVVANRLLLTNSEQPAEGLGLAAIYDRVRPTLNPSRAVMTAIHKFATATALAEAGLPVPDALLALSGDRLNDGRTTFGEEAVYKTAIGTHGGGTWKVSLAEPLNPRVGQRQAFLQSYIDRDGGRNRDLRVYVVDGEVLGAMTRYAPANDWRTNVALGGEVADATDQLDGELRGMAREAADTIGLDYAGVDLVEGPDGWSILEVNPTAGFKGFFKATGLSPAPYIGALAIERAGGQVDRGRVRSLAETLDDSAPGGAPESPRQPAPETAVIGYTEEVVVAGTTGAETVVAKSDTGASRTSIDTTVAAAIGAGPIQRLTRVKSGSRKSAKTRPVVDVVVGIRGRQHTVAASVEDRSHMDYPVLLGRDILQHYQVDVKKRADGAGADTESEE